MNKSLIILSLSFGLLINSASADGLANNLNSMLNKKETAPMMDLSNLNVNAKPIPPKVKVRSSKAVVATVNGRKIIKKQADKYLKKRTKGKVKNFDILPKKQRIRLLQEMSISTLVADAAKKELSEQEKIAISTRVWMQKEARKIKVTDKKVKEIYTQMEQRSKEANSQEPIPSFDSIKDRMKSQMVEKEIVAKLMKGVELKVINANMIAGSINDIYISIEDADNALNTISKGKATWAVVSENDRMKLLNMIAPSKLIEAAAKKDLKAKDTKIAFSNFWMQTKVSKIKVSDKKLKSEYNKIKKSAKKSKSKEKIPEFKELKKTLKMQIAKEKVMSNLMKSAKIRLK
ncbi:MAG: hypothetical protein KAI79_00260 [Bacteroidales bacterium]|nr:hypothetical protein [Bacteroidales bacterium]